MAGSGQTALWGSMADRSYAPSTTCAKDGCIGVPLPMGTNCWAHVDGQVLEAALEQLRETGRLDARGVPISEQLLERLFANLPQDQSHWVLTDASFDHATFTQARFYGTAWFSGTTLPAGGPLQRSRFPARCSV
jgi:hypothetical protein